MRRIRSVPNGCLNVPFGLREVDPTLATLENLNHPEDYERALRAAGFGEG